METAPISKAIAPGLLHLRSMRLWENQKPVFAAPRLFVGGENGLLVVKAVDGQSSPPD